MFRLAGDVAHHRVLDAGCGQGNLTLHLMRSGADVTAVDLSPAMIDIVRRRSAIIASDTRLPRLIAAPIEHSGLEDASFDVIVGKYVLHHIDLEVGGRELARLLQPGGRAVFIENTATNPLLSFARRHVAGRLGVPRLGTVDEHPIRERDLELLKSSFVHVAVHHPVFEFLILFDRQVLRFRYPRVTRLLGAADDLIHRRAPRLRRYSYRAVIELRSAR
jgi:SAM-dependent methyltransferase